MVNRWVQVATAVGETHIKPNPILSVHSLLSGRVAQFVSNIFPIFSGKTKLCLADRSIRGQQRSFRKHLASHPGGILKKVSNGEAPARGPTPYPFISHFFTKKVPPFVYPLLTNGTLHIPCSELCIPFNCYKCTVFKEWLNLKARTFSRLLQSHKMNLVALLGLFTDRNDAFPYPFKYFNKWIKFSPKIWWLFLPASLFVEHASWKEATERDIEAAKR